MADEVCGNCRFWYTDPQLDAENAFPEDEPGSCGECFRFPPQRSANVREREDSVMAWSFPVLHKKKWCGEWKAKEGGGVPDMVPPVEEVCASIRILNKQLSVARRLLRLSVRTHGNGQT